MKDARSQVAMDPIAAARREDGSLGSAELILAYESGPEAVRSSVRGLSIVHLRARPVAGRWSTLEVLCHLADSEQVFADRMKRTIARERPLLLGVVGALAAPLAGRFADRCSPRWTIGAGLTCVLLSYTVFSGFVRTPWGLVEGVIVLDLGAQSAHITNQSRIFAVRPEARGRMNTAYMVTSFVGGRWAPTAGGGAGAWRAGAGSASSAWQ